MLDAASHVEPESVKEFIAIYSTEMVQKEPTAKARLDKAKSMMPEFEKLGIEFYERYDPDILENVYRTATDKGFSKGKKIAMVVLNKNDWNGAFGDHSQIYRSLVENNYALVICEAGNEREVVARLFGQGVDRVENANAVSGRKYDFLILGGHGDPASIDFGGWTKEQWDNPLFGRIDVSDYRPYSAQVGKGAWKGLFTPDASIGFASCSTGGEIEKGSEISNPGNFQNVMEMVGTLAMTRVFAPKSQTNLTGLVFKNGRVVGVEYRDAETKMYRPPEH
jgi:hypothetical protein